MYSNILAPSKIFPKCVAEGEKSTLIKIRKINALSSKQDIKKIIAIKLHLEKKIMSEVYGNQNSWSKLITNRCAGAEKS